MNILRGVLLYVINLSSLFFYENNSYSVVFPDLNWLATQEDTLQEAMEMAVD